MEETRNFEQNPDVYSICQNFGEMSSTFMKAAYGLLREHGRR